jgi:RimJ/RimL family protein N-acetyltransferase
MASIPNLNQPLRDGRVVLRLAAERDIPEVLIAHQDDPNLHTSLGLARPPSGAELGRRMEEAEHDRADGARITLTILESGSDDCRGQIEVSEVDWDRRSASLQIWVAPELRGQGVEGAALGLARRWLSEECGLDA